MQRSANSPRTLPNKILRIAICDPHQSTVDCLDSYLRLKFDTWIIVTDPPQLLKFLQNGHYFDLVICEIVQPFMSGLAMCEVIKKNYQPTKVILTTDLREDRFVEKARDYGADWLFYKPIELKEMRNTIKWLLGID